MAVAITSNITNTRFSTRKKSILCNGHMGEALNERPNHVSLNCTCTARALPLFVFFLLFFLGLLFLEKSEVMCVHIVDKVSEKLEECTLFSLSFEECLPRLTHFQHNSSIPIHCERAQQGVLQKLSNPSTYYSRAIQPTIFHGRKF